MKIDYCNALYFKIHGTLLNKLQHVQNAAARIIKRKFNMRSIDDVFLEMHWLRVEERIIYKLVLIAHKCTLGIAPPDLCSMFHFSSLKRLSMLIELRVTTRFGERAFSHVGPKLWNLLPLQLKAEKSIPKFKKLLKSHLLLHGQKFIERSQLK